MMFRRRLENILEQDLHKKMVLLAGPRQCGKTHLAKKLVRSLKGTYYNWDIEKDRHLLLNHRLNAQSNFWALDEIHKYRRWRNWLKGIFDEYANKKQILVTGSAKLDVYSRGGDSLQGRYYFHRLHPLTFSELLNNSFKSAEEMFTFPNEAKKIEPTVFKDMLCLGGFPEPFLSGSEREAKRWRLSYGTRVLREEVVSMEQVLELDKMELLFHRLPDVIQSPLSINSLREDLEVTFRTVKNWLSIFENLYMTFSLPPFGPTKIKAVKKEQKIYFWDWSRANSEAARGENMVAVHLMRLCHWLEDVEGQNAELRYMRTRMGHEVDFVILISGKPWLAVEVKSSAQDLDAGLRYFSQRMTIPTILQVHLHGTDDWAPPKVNNNHIRILPASRFLAQLP